MRADFEDVNELWARYMCGARLSSAEERFLCDAMERDGDLRRGLRQDHEIHQMLIALKPAKGDGDDGFVNAVMARCRQVQSDGIEVFPVVDGAGSRHLPCNRSKNGFGTPEPPPVAKDDVELPPISTPASATPFHRSVKSVPRNRDSRARRSRQKSSPSLTPAHILVAGLAIVLFFGLGVMTGIIVSGPSELSRPQATNDKHKKRRNSDDPRPHAPPIKRTGIATITSSDFGAWERPRVAGSRLEPGHVQLRHGRAEIAFDNGTVLKLVGPADIRLVSLDKIAVNRGAVSASVPKSVNGLKVLTPASQVVDRGAEFALAVSDAGATDVLVHHGDLTVEPWGKADSFPMPLMLTSSNRHRATVFEPVDGNLHGPLATVVRSVDGDFSGQITINGRSMEFSSPESFENMRKNVWGRFRESADRLEQDWSDAVRIGTSDGSLQLNGVNFGFDSVDDILKLQQRIFEAARKRPDDDGGASRSGSFEGTLNINGEVRKFSTPEEFEAAQREAFGSLKGLGIDVFDKARLKDVFETLLPKDDAAEKPVVPREEDEPAPTNPFIPKEK